MEWKGKVSAQVRSFKAEQAWSLLKDFGGLHRWVPSLHTCEILEGVNGQPGCVRYCAGHVNGTTTPAWSTERLLGLDPVNRSYRYEIVENNKGFGRYEAEIRVVDGLDGCDCVIEWSFAAEPVEGYDEVRFVVRVGELVAQMAERVGEALRAGV
ncbi:Lachrymatory-factor synthase [Acorus gramineus]|uniref:Lachrymatory-factor synthase n=1 Tax=Acorus gramineus TaxID=55184 RepID=A0AAV9ANG5_ACOGR|nr:Lachrymatory-factor synthase [Acorus gramineus]